MVGRRPADRVSLARKALCADALRRAARQITPDDWPHPSGPAWSPDGRQIAWACRWDAGNALYLVAAAGGKPTLLYDKKPACQPRWSPDGKRLVYETETNVCTIGADGKKNRVITYFGGVQHYGRYSPDGQSIVYCQGASERRPVGAVRHTGHGRLAAAAYAGRVGHEPRLAVSRVAAGAK